MTRPRSVLLREWEVRAIQDGRLTMLARPMNPQPEHDTDCPYHIGTGERMEARVTPFGAVGDVLLGKEAWQRFMEDEVPTGHPHGPQDTMGRPSNPEIKSHIYYRADGELIHPDQGRACWCPAQHMPQWAVRIRLRVESVACKRVQEITEGDAMACGYDPTDGAFIFDRCRKQWDADNPRHPWAENPWCWLARVGRVTP